MRVILYDISILFTFTPVEMTNSSTQYQYPTITHD